MDAVGERLEIVGVGSGTVDRPLLVAMKNVPAPLASAVSSLAVDGEQLLHAGDEICLRGLQQEMEVIAHERPCMDLPPKAQTKLAEPVEKRLMVVLCDKQGTSPVAAGHHPTQAKLQLVTAPPTSAAPRRR